MAQPIRRGSRFPVSLFEPIALWDPVSELEYLRDRMGRLYNQITPQGPGQSPWQPDIEVDETEEFYLVEAELPGITRDNVELQADEHSLSITGSVREEQSEHTMHRRRAVLLPRGLAQGHRHRQGPGHDEGGDPDDPPPEDQAGDPPGADPRLDDLFQGVQWS